LKKFLKLLLILALISCWVYVAVPNAMRLIPGTTLVVLLALAVAVPVIVFGLHFGTSYVAYNQGESFWWQLPILWIPVLGPLFYWAAVYLRKDKLRRQRPTSVVFFFTAFIFLGSPSIVIWSLTLHEGYERLQKHAESQAPQRASGSSRHSAH
jgi:hypothetical protein